MKAKTTVETQNIRRLRELCVRLHRPVCGVGGGGERERDGKMGFLMTNVKNTLIYREMLMIMFLLKSYLVNVSSNK